MPAANDATPGDAALVDCSVELDAAPPSAARARGAARSDDAVALRAALFVALGGLAFGFDLGVISGALPSLTAEFGLSARQQGLVAGALAFGEVPGALALGALADARGRRPALLATNGALLGGALLLATARGVGQLVAGRALAGAGVGASWLSCTRRGRRG